MGKGCWPLMRDVNWIRQQSFHVSATGLVLLSSMPLASSQTPGWGTALLPAPEDWTPQEKPGCASRLLSKAPPPWTPATQQLFPFRSTLAPFSSPLLYLLDISGPTLASLVLSLSTHCWENSLPSLWGSVAPSPHRQSGSLFSAGQCG